MAKFSISLSITSWWHVSGSRGKISRIFNFGISKSDCRSGRFISEETSSEIHCKRAGVGPRFRMSMLANRMIIVPLKGWKSSNIWENQNSIQEEIKSRLKSGNACYHSVQNLLSSSLLSKNLKIKIYRIITLLVVLYGCETWSLTMRKERRLRASENRVLRTFGPTRDEVTGEWRKLHNEELNDLYSSHNFVRMIKSRRMKWAGHVARMGGGKRRVQGFGTATWGKGITGETQS